DLGEGRFIAVEAGAAQLQSALQNGDDAFLIVTHTPTVYTVVSGDNLIRIAWKTGIPFWRIAAANPNVNTEALSPGQTLSIPSRSDLLPLPVIPNKRLIISISEQRLWGYEDGQLVYDEIISTGIDRSPTQPGVFQVQTHEDPAYAGNWDLWMPHFLGIYEAWPGFMNGLHGLPTLSSGVTLWADVLGQPASYGCIILDLPTAESMYSWAEAGTVVEIVE
ncbi:MAG: L,D-transpeptidase family protein, partial [Chloroflexi bacterium]|nr:L,D-transpeptidase family protein [Chloroflexota bacterium]